MLVPSNRSKLLDTGGGGHVDLCQIVTITSMRQNLTLFTQQTPDCGTDFQGRASVRGPTFQDAPHLNVRPCFTLCGTPVDPRRVSPSTRITTFIALGTAGRNFLHNQRLARGKPLKQVHAVSSDFGFISHSNGKTPAPAMPYKRLRMTSLCLAETLLIVSRSRANGQWAGVSCREFQP